MATQSLIAISRSFIKVSNYAQNIEEIHHEALGGSEKRRFYQDSFSRAREAHKLEETVLIIGTLYVSLISISVNLVVGPFMLHFRLLIRDNPTIVIILVRLVVNL